jgi:hypothetical protein
MNKLSEIVEYNRTHRVHKVPHITGLVELDNINYSKNMLNDIGGALILPKKHKSITMDSDIFYINRQEKYNTYCATYFPVMFDILNLVKGIVLCGGAPLWIYNQSCIHRPNTISILIPKTIPKDFDIFLYEENDLSPEELIISQDKKINDIIQIILNHNFNIKLFLVKGVMTLQLCNNKNSILNEKLCIQIILRDYHSISEILHSFDISCCAIAWDGKKTYLTKLAEWSILTNVNIVIPEYRSKTYELRLIKYFNDKHFGLLLPHINLTTLKTLCLPNISFNIYHIDGNMAIADAYIPKPDLLDMSYLSDDEECDYDKITNNYMIDLFEYKFPSTAFKKNCYLIMKNKKYFEKIVFLYKKNTICNFMQSTISDIVSLELYKKWTQTYIKKNIIIYEDEYKLNKFFIKEILEENYEKFAKDNDIENVILQLAILNEKILIKKSPNISGKLYILNKLINKLAEYIYSLYNGDEVLNFNIQLNRDIPLTGSLHPSRQTPQEWYGEHYTASSMKIKYKSIKEFIDKHINEDCEKNTRVCPLCFEQIHYLSKNAITLKCGHIYHENKNDECEGINMWFSKHKPASCPECRTKNPKKEKAF